MLSDDLPFPGRGRTKCSPILLQVLNHFFGGGIANGRQVDESIDGGPVSVQLRQIADAGMANRRTADIGGHPRCDSGTTNGCWYSHMHICGCATMDLFAVYVLQLVHTCILVASGS